MDRIAGQTVTAASVSARWSGGQGGALAPNGGVCVEVIGRAAPSLEFLKVSRQYAQRTVYPSMAKTLLDHDTHPSQEIAHLLATCSGYAYGDELTVAMLMARMGLPNNHCLRITESIDAMLIRATAQLVQSSDGRVVILCYRGTQLLDIINWLASIDVRAGPMPISIPGSYKPFDVHGGFYRNVRSIRFEVIHALNRALAGKNIINAEEPMPNPMQALYLTGHSLGGAMAALMTIMLLADPGYAKIAETLRATYTFAQPMMGNKDFAAACNANDFLRNNVFRYIYNRDIVPRVPPAFTGAFAHFGQEYEYVGRGLDGHWKHNGTPMRQLRHVLPFLLSPLPILTRQITALKDLRFAVSLQDHFPRHYVAALAPSRTCSEFGE
ncbi:MAG: lipase family protein [Acidimicrobiales bacterium]